MEAYELRKTDLAKSIRFLILLFILTRVLVLVTAYLGMNLFSDYSKPSVYKEMPWPWVDAVQMQLETDLTKTKWPELDRFLTSDTFAYVNIADQGYDKYRIDEPHPPANWVFFPLYPIALRVYADIVHTEYLTGGLVMSNLFLLVGMIYFYLIGLNRGLKDVEAKAAVCLLLIAPASIFFAVPYTESLFLMLSMGAVYYSLTGRWFYAFLLAGLCTITRNVGAVILLYTLASMLLERRFRKPERRDWTRLSFIVTGCIPLAAYLTYMKWLTGDFLAPLHEQINWGRYTSIPFSSYFHYLQKPYFQTSSGWENGLMSFIVATSVIVVFVVYFIVKRRTILRDGKQLLLYIAGVLLIVIPFSSGEHLASIPRYMTVCFPFYIYVVQLCWPRSKITLAGYAMFAFLFHIVFIIGYFNNYLFVF